MENIFVSHIPLRNKGIYHFKNFYCELYTFQIVIQKTFANNERISFLGNKKFHSDENGTEGVLSEQIKF